MARIFFFKWLSALAWRVSGGTADRGPGHNAHFMLKGNHYDK
jgi:hypothetical protein